MRILFISHDAYPFGAQKLLLHLLKWIKESEEDIRFDTLLLGNGRLMAEFKELSDRIFILSEEKQQSWCIQVQNINELDTTGYDLIYANSVSSMKMSVELKKQSTCPLFLHVHELESVIEDRASNFDALSENVDLFIAASKLVKRNLEKNHQITSGKIKVIYEFSIAKGVNTNQKQAGDKLIIGGSGWVSYRKGVDIFIQAAVLFKKRFPDHKVQFQWIGGTGKSLHEAQLEVEKADMSEYIKLIEMVDNPIDYYSSFDVLLMTSREDPFPLVCIEAGQLGKPIICFRGVTGTEEIVEQGGGKVVPYLDLMELTDKLDEYYCNPEKLTRDGSRATELFSEFTPEKVCPQIIKEIREVVVENKMTIKPNFLIIGANKGGTSSLFRYLTEHPDVFRPDIKEPMFFNYYKNQHEDTNFRTQRVIRSISSYHTLFAGSENFKAAGEASTSYLANPYCAEHIYDYNPEMKLIAILRNPIQRAYSNYLMYVRWGDEKRSFSKALRDELNNKTLQTTFDLHTQGKRYIALGYYHDSLMTYQKQFGKHQLKVFLNEDLKDKPEETFKSICTYLNIATNFTPDLSKKYNTNNRVETRPLLKFLKAVNRRLHLTKPLPDSIRKRIATKPTMKNKDKQLLLSLYSEEIDNLQIFLNRDLNHWKK